MPDLVAIQETVRLPAIARSQYAPLCTSHTARRSSVTLYPSPNPTFPDVITRLFTKPRIHITQPDTGAVTGTGLWSVHFGLSLVNSSLGTITNLLSMTHSIILDILAPLVSVSNNNLY